MDDAIKIAGLILGVLTLAGNIVLGVLVFLGAKGARTDAKEARAGQRAAATAVKEVQATTEETARAAKLAAERVQSTLARSTTATSEQMAALSVVVDATHTLVNSNYGASLMATLNALTAVLRLTTNLDDKPAAEAAVVEAQRLYDDHLAKQAVVDDLAQKAPAP